MRHRFLALAALAALAPVPAYATPHPLPFTYPYMTLPKGKIELEQYTDLTPVRIAREKENGDEESIWSVRSILQSELEIGITDRLEGALYFAFHQSAAASPTLQFDGLKQRLRYRFADTGVWPVDVGVYFEVAELHNEFELEEKVILSKRFGGLTLTTNLWIEQEYYFQDEDWKLVFNPTAGGSYELSPSAFVGLEYWARGRFDEDGAQTMLAAETPTSARHYLGPTMLLQTGEFAMSLGAYVRMDHMGGAIPVGDGYGRMWFRLLISVGL